MTAASCRELAVKASKASAIPPVPDPSLQVHWHAFVQALQAAVQDCTPGAIRQHPALERDLVTAVKAVQTLAIEFPSEVTRLPPN